MKCSYNLCIKLSVLFCSDSCKTAHTERDYHTGLHEVETEDCFDSKLEFVAKVFLKMHEHFKGFPRMRRFLKLHEHKKYTLFDFDWSNPNDPAIIENLFLTIMGAENDKKLTLRTIHKCTKGAVDDIFTWFCAKLSDENPLKIILFAHIVRHHDFIENVLVQILKASFSSYAMTILPDDGFLGTLFHPGTLLLNHSCDPNIISRPVDQNKMAWIVLRPIKAGSQIFMPYSDPYYSNESGKSSGYTCEFKKTCVPCRDGWRKSIDTLSICMQSIERFSKHFLPKMDNSCNTKTVVKHLMSHVDTCANFINRNYGKYETDAETRRIIATKLVEFISAVELIKNFDNPILRN